MRKCPTCGKFMRRIRTLTWEIDRYVPDVHYLCRTCDYGPPRSMAGALGTMGGFYG